jgi:hypothetical protein
MLYQSEILAAIFVAIWSLALENTEIASFVPLPIVGSSPAVEGQSSRMQIVHVAKPTILPPNAASGDLEPTKSFEDR